MAPKYAMSDSDSEPEVHVSSTPSDEALEKALRDTVAAIFKSGNMDELTVKRVRLAAESSLGLETGYFKSTGTWKLRSEEIIKDEVDIQDQAMQNPPSQTAQKSPSPPAMRKATAVPKRSKAVTASKPRKRQKTATPVDEDNELSATSGSEDDEVTKPKKRSKAPAKKASVKQTKKDDSEDSKALSGDESEEMTEPEKQTKAAPKKMPAKNAKEHASDASDVSNNDSDVAKPIKDTNESDSEMSVVLDEEPQRKAPRKRQKSSEGGTKKQRTTKKKDEELSPDQAEIKRLQGWLIKCGIRKLWGKELAPYDTPKAKIKHLKKMLEDAGMTGRPSQEKANQIREERELKADLELIQEGAKQWGAKSDEEDEGNGGKPRRRLARGRQALAFLESDGEETD